MKHLTHYYIGMLLAGAFGFLAACSSDEELLTPSGEDTNFFLPKEDDHSAEAALRRDFFDETGVYLFFNDTLRHDLNGTDVNGAPVYATEVLNFRYSLTGYNNAAYAFGYYQTQEEKVAAAEMIKADFLPHLSQNLLPYSILLVNGIRENSYGSTWKDLAYKSNIYCIAIDTKDVMHLGAGERREIAQAVLTKLVEKGIKDLNWDDYQGPFYDLIPKKVVNSFMGDLIPGWDRTQMEALYELGFISYSEDWYDEFYYDTPPFSDWNDFFELVMNTPWEEIEAQYGAYSLLMQRLELVRQAILATGYKF